MAKKRNTVGPGAPALTATVADLRALAHPLRLRILELFAEGPKTTKRVAELLGEPPTRLYHHVAALERSGLLKLKETRKNRGTVEKWYEAISRTMGVTDSGKTKPADAAGRRALAMTVLEQAKQEVANAMTQRGSEPPLVARLVMSAPPATMPAVRQRLYDFLKEIKAEYDCGDAAEAADEHERWSMTLSFAPVWPKGTRSR